MQFNSIRFKASILYSAILALILIVFSTVVYLSVRNIFYHDLDRELKIKAEEISDILYAYEQIERSREHPLGAILEMLRSEGIGANQKMVIDELWRSQLEVLNLKNDFMNILNIRGRAVLNSNNFKGGIASLFRKDFPFVLNGVIFKSLHNEQYKLRAINLPIKLHNAQLVIQVGTSLEFIDHVLQRLLLLMIGTMIVLLVITSFMGNVFAEYALRPVKEVADLANKISYKDLSVRIEERKIDVEMKMLVNAFNIMIERLETSFGHINEFSSHAAHELKTPLAILRGEMELALDEEKSSVEYKKVITDSLSEIDRMIKIVKDLLLLAKYDYKPEFYRFKRINLVPFLNEIYEQSKILAEPKEITVEFNLPKDEIMINADNVHLRRLFHNIIGNAIKYTPAKRKVTLTATTKDAQCIIDIIDTGEGISEENMNKIFNKFYRINKDDETSEASTGLGLSIALSIANAHNGDIKVQSTLHQGTTFTVILPLA